MCVDVCGCVWMCECVCVSGREGYTLASVWLQSVRISARRCLCVRMCIRSECECASVGMCMYACV